jgi:hypothetical protein
MDVIGRRRTGRWSSRRLGLRFGRGATARRRTTARLALATVTVGSRRMRRTRADHGARGCRPCGQSEDHQHHHGRSVRCRAASDRSRSNRHSDRTSTGHYRHGAASRSGRRTSQHAHGSSKVCQDTTLAMERPADSLAIGFGRSQTPSVSASHRPPRSLQKAPLGISLPTHPHGTAFAYLR